MSSTILERNILQIQKCFVFKIPPASAAGHKAKEWPTEPVWSGRLRLQTKNNGKCYIFLEHTDKDGIFAQTEYTEKSVEQVIDSSRYFVVKFVNASGQTAMLGIGFNTREEAFDFKVGLQDYLNGTVSEERVSAAVDQLGPSIDFSLPQDATIKVTIKNKKPQKSSNSSSNKSSNSGSGSGLFALAPPPKKGDATRKKKRKNKKKDDDSDDLFGLADAFSGATVNSESKQSSSSSNNNNNNNNNDPFATFDSDPFAEMTNAKW